MLSIQDILKLKEFADAWVYWTVNREVMNAEKLYYHFSY